MKNDRNLQFITRSITDAGQVMLYRNFTSGNKQAIGIKTDFHIDENGVLHFPINTQFEENITTNFFPVDLFFYKKGKQFYLTAHGLAEKSNEKNSSKISVKMDKVEFVHTAIQKRTNFINDIIAKASKVMNLFL